ncbi:MAG: hypothetical protein ACLRFI_01885 [Alphaproteobacteria bacterium]
MEKSKCAIADYKDIVIAQDKLYGQIIDVFQLYKFIDEISDEISKINADIDSDMQNENALIQDCFKQEIQKSK